MANLSNPVADVSQNVLTMPQKVISVDLNGNAMAAAPSSASADAVSPASIQETSLGAYNGATIDRVRIPTVIKNIAAQAVTASTPVTIWTPTTGKKFRILRYAVSLSVAGSVIFKDATTEILRTPLVAAGTGSLSGEGLGNGILSTATNAVLAIDVSASGSVSGWVSGVEES